MPPFEGGLSLPLQYLINTLADSNQFRASTDTFDRTSAKALIYTGGIDESEDTAPPRAIVRLGQGHSASRQTTDSWETAGPLEMLITLMNPVGYEYHENYVLMLNTFGKIRDEMLALVQTDIGAGPYLDITTISLDYFGQWEIDLDGTDAYWDASFIVNWRGM